MHPYVKDLTGQTFGMLTVVGPASRPEGSTGRGQHWGCICECLKAVVVRSDSLRQGKSTSCGCTNPVTTAMRSAIRPRRTKSTVSEHPAKDCAKSTHEQIMSMNENQSTFSTVSIAVGELVGLRNDLRGLHSNGRGTRMALKWIDATLELAKPTAPLPSFANENDRPRGALAEFDREHPLLTVKVETMSEQAERFAGISLTLPAAAPAPTTGLKFKPALVNLSERKHSHYFKKCPYDAVDVYRVLALFGVTDQALGHAIKKLLVAGGRGAGKDISQDVQEAIDACERFIEMRAEDVTAGLELLELLKA